MTRLSGLVALTISAITMSAGVIAMPQAPAPSPSVLWEQSESVSVRLTVKGREWQSDSVEAECFVEGPISSESLSRFGQPNGVRSTRKWTVKRDHQQSLYFPEDFSRKPFPGEYRWGCTVGERTIAQGRFEYIATDQARVIR
jgi:hypothetical protein